MVDLRVPRLLALGGIGGRMVVLRLLQRLGTNRPGSGVGSVGANPRSKRLFELLGKMLLQIPKIVGRHATAARSAGMPCLRP